jgi:tRNA-specific 2-thiouridylase
VTVAAVIEQAGRFLLVEEHTADGLRLNQPAGHLEAGETLVQAVSRETLEETAHAFSPQALVGVYMTHFARPGHTEVTYLRFAFCGTAGHVDATRALDTGIVRTLWLSADELRACPQRHRTPLVLQCVEDYLAGRTPNPDVLCNAEIKFKAFLDHAVELGAQTIATGHYARVRQDQHGLFQLLKAADLSKDQSYFLHRLNQQQLSRTIFPLGEMPKTEVRALAERIGLPNAKKKDSTGICFIGERPFRDFLNRYLPTQPGPMKTPDGRVVGEHIGLAFYTLGQRKGIGLGGSRDSSGEPWFAAAKDIAANTLYVVQGHEHPWLLSQVLHAGNTSWVAGSAPPPGTVCAAKTRYRQSDAPCRVEAVPGMPDGFALAFEAAQWAVTPGQSAVLYDGEVCLGGGIITGACAAAAAEPHANPLDAEHAAASAAGVV